MNKRLSFAILTVSALLFAGCSRMAEDNLPIGHSFTVRASFDVDNAKTTVLDGGSAIYWAPEDEINVFCGTSSGRLKSTNTENAATATFTGTATGEIRPSSSSMLYALYPYREDAAFKDGTITTTLPESQCALAGTFDSRANIAMAVSDNNELKFKNVCGGLRFTLENPGIKRIVFESNGGEYIAGEFSAQFKDGVPVVKEVKRGSRKVCLEKEDGSAFESGKWYYMSFLPGTLSNGYTITFSTDSQTAVLEVAKEQVIKRHVYGTISEIDSNVEWEDEELKKDTFVLKEGVKTISKTDVAKYLSSIEQNSFFISDNAPASLIPEVGDIMFFETENEDVRYVLGKVTEIVQTKSPGYTVTIEDISLGEIFKEFHICEELTLSDVPQTITDEDGNEYEYGIGSPDIWDKLTTPVSDTTTVGGQADSTMVERDVRLLTKASGAQASRYPGFIKIANEFLEGNLYLDLVVKPDIRFDEALQTVIANVDCEIRTGFEGSVRVKAEGHEDFNILKNVKVPVGSFGIFTFYFSPDLSLFCEGSASVGGDVRLELYHSRFVMTNEPGKSCQYTPLEKQNYFNVHLFKADGAIGVRLGAGIHSCVFNEKLFGFGMDLSTSLKAQVSGQFPSEDGNDLSKSLIATILPTVDLSGFIDWRVALNRPDKLEIPIFSASLNPYEVDLLPWFKCISSKINPEGTGAVVQAQASRKSFISSTEGGYCLFKKGEDAPLTYRPMYMSAVKSQKRAFGLFSYSAPASSENGDGTLTFDIEKGQSYEIAPYAVVNDDEYVYGDKIPLNMDIRDYLIRLYETTDGDHWKRNDNWCSDRPIGEWYGVDDRSPSYLVLSLNQNNLNGYIDMSGCEVLERLFCSGNDGLISLNLSGCRHLYDLRCSHCSLETLDLSGCGGLGRVECDYNFLTRLDVSCIGQYDVGHHFDYESLSCSNNSLTSLDLSGNKNWEWVDCSNNSITNLDLSGCIYMASVRCSNNSLTSLDLSDCISMTTVDCLNNSLTSLDLSCNKNWETVYCSNNSITNLDLSGQSQLWFLDIEDNPLDSLNVSGCTKLSSLRNYDSSKYLDISGTALSDISISVCEEVRAIGCPELEKIVFSDNYNTRTVDVSGSTKLYDIYGGAYNLASLNLSGCIALHYFSVYGDHPNPDPAAIYYFLCPSMFNLSLEGCTGLESLEVRYMYRQYVEPAENEWYYYEPILNVSGCTALREAVITESDFESLDFSDLESLTYLDCSNNSFLRNLYVDNCTALKELHCRCTSLTDIDLTSCPALEILDWK